MAIIDSNQGRVTGVSVVVNKKDTGEIVPSPSENVSLVNAGQAAKAFSTLKSLTDTNLADSPPVINDYLVYDGEDWVNRQITGDIEVANLNTWSLVSSGVDANTYGSATDIPIITIDAKGRITNATVATFDANSFSLFESISYLAANNTIQIDTTDGNSYFANISLFQDQVTLYDAVVNVATIDTANISTADVTTLSVDDGSISNAVLTVATVETLDANNTTIDTAEIGTANVTTLTVQDASITNVVLTTADVETITVNNATIETVNSTTVTAADVTVTGNLYVQGTQTVIDTQQLLIEDPIFVVGKNQTTPIGDLGFIGQRYSTTSNTNYNVGFYWDESADKFVAASTLEAATDSDIAPIDYLTLKAGVFEGNLTFTNITNRPSPNVSIELTGDVEGTAEGSMTTLDTDITLTVNAELKDTGVVANTYGNNFSIPVFTVDVDGRITEANTVTVDIIANTGWYPANNTFRIDYNGGNWQTFTIAEWQEFTQFGTINATFISANSIDVESIQLSPNVSITVNGDVQGVATAELTNLNTDADIEISLELTDTGVTANSYGNATNISVLTIDVDGRVTDANDVAVSIEHLNTDQLDEGNTNLYFTEDRVQTKLGNVNNHILPTDDIAYDIGSANNRFRDLYLSGNTITLGVAEIGSVDSTVNLPANSTIDGTLILVGTSTDDVSEGNNNLYYTTARANDDIDARVTDTFIDNLNPNAQTVFGNTAADLLSFSNFTDLPSPNVSITVNGDVQGVATADIANLASDAELSLSLELTDTGVTANTYGSASKVPVITIDVDGRITEANTVSVAGVSNVEWYTANNTYQINTADGGTFNQTIDQFDANVAFNDINANNVVISGNLTVSGTTTQLDTSNVLVEDPILLLGKDQTTPTVDIGFVGQRYSATSNTDLNIGLIWKENVDQFQVVYTQENANDTLVTVDAFADFRANDVTANNLTVNSIGLSPNVSITVNGDIQGTATAALTNLNTDADLSLSLELTDTGVIANTYGNASSIPVFTVDVDGRITEANTVAVAGVSNTDWYAANNTLEISTADGGTFAVTLDDFNANVAFENITATTVTANTIDVNGIELSPNVSITVNGDVQGVATAELTNLNTDADIEISLELTDTGVVANTYGSASMVPVLTIDVDGRITDANAVSVAGVSNTTWHTANNTYRIDTADGGAYETLIDTFTANVATQDVLAANVVTYNGISEQSTNTATTTTTSATVIDSFDLTEYRTVKYLISIKEGSDVHTTEFLMCHNDTNVYITEYATLTSSGVLATFTANVNANTIELVASPASISSTEFKITRNLVSV